MTKATPLNATHRKAGARMVDFGGWDMPLHYGSQVEEHHAVRGNAGVFDVSHMTVVDIGGTGARDFLRFLLANDIARLEQYGKAMYSCMLTPDGGVVDDLITYFLGENDYRLVVNAATRDKDIAWIDEQAGAFDVSVDERAELAMIAVQGPNARELAAGAIDEQHRAAALALQPFTAAAAGDLFVARTGYTGEDGWEIIAAGEQVADLWQRITAAGVQPCGLGARDTLRLEAGMNLYGSDMDESTSPLESGLGWTIAWEPAEREFIGRAAVEQMRLDKSRRRFCGLLLEDKGVLRNHQRIVVEGVGEGEITSGGFSPTLQRSIAMARLPAGDYQRAQVEMRGKLLDVRVVKMPFVRYGKIKVDL
ncbi:MAG: glycine cleavage system aminomethyltransferase GcvT [Gammaproteobacteria bacterium]|nr:glycine cleavage system aminomethyltransferase GcvT [Gammaproteobacteria bacterium]